MNPLHQSAIKSAEKVRLKLGVNMFSPINIYDTCEALNVTVRIVPINMEGLYVQSDKKNNSTILLSNERPIPRRVFTCAHELGHHTYSHGSKIDALTHTNQYTPEQDEEELLVNSFAGYLLMPIAGVFSEFRKRRWNPQYSTPEQFYAISSTFGVGYNTLVYHCRANNIINFSKATELLKYSPKKIFVKEFSKELAIDRLEAFFQEALNLGK